MTTTTVYHLTAITDESITKTHLGAKEREPGKTFCGVQLLVKNDTRFGGRYKGIVYTASADLVAVDCGACKRSAAWKNRKGSIYTPAAPQPKVTMVAGKAGR